MRRHEVGREGFLRVGDLGPIPALLAHHVGTQAVARAFRGQGVPLSILDHPMHMITQRDFCGLHEWAVRVAGHPEFGFEIAKAFDLSHLGPLSTYLMSSPNLVTMIHREGRAIQVYQSGGEIRLEHDRETVRFVYASGLGSLMGRRYAGERCLFALVGLVRAFAGRQWLPNSIEVEYSSVTGDTSLEDHFGLPVTYDRPVFALTFSRDLLATPNPNPLPVRRQMTLREFARALEILPPRTTVEATRMVLDLLLLEGRDDIDGTAMKLGLGPRTLQRRLHEEGTNYRRTLNALRLERALALLQDSSEPIEAIALSLGYAETSHFTRAFTQWTGSPPSQMREQARRRSLS